MITNGGPGDGSGGLVAGRYRMRELVGEGGMGSVWRATDELLGREVAIKRVRLDRQPPGEVALSRERTLREARIAAALHHPNVVTIFDVVTDGGEPWLVLEYLPSRSLGSILSEYGALHPAHVANIGVQLAAALAAAHAAGIVHRDVKPDNILIAGAPGNPEPLSWPGTVVKLTDFGISHAAATPALTSTGVLTGTPAYFAPETARGEGTDARSDVYSLGATLYAAVEGRPPFGSGDENVLALLARVGQGGAPPPQRAGPLTDLLRRLTADAPAARPTAEQARSALHSMLVWRPPQAPQQHIGHHQGMPYPGPPLPQQRYRSGGGVLAAVLAVLLVAVVIAGLTFVAFQVARPGPASASGDTPSSTSAPADGAPAPTTPSAESIGDPRTADPCSLVDQTVLSRFGAAVIDRDNSEFSACRTDMVLSSGAEVTYLVDFLSPPEVGTAAPGAGYEESGTLTIVRQPGTPEQCERRLLFPDGNVVGIQVELANTTTADLCAIADAGTDFAVGTIAQRGIGTRTPLDATSSLAAVEACSLLSSGELAVVPDVRTAEPESEFGGWGCIWSPDSGDQQVRMDFYHRYPLHDGDGVATAFGVHQGAYRYQEGRYCLAQIDQRDYPAADGTPRADVVRIFVFGAAAEAEQCGYATALANAVAPKLPPG